MAQEGIVHFGLLLIGHGGGLLVGALHQPHARSQLVHPLDVAAGAMQARLQRHAQVAVVPLPQDLERLERALGIGRILHVDAHEAVHLLRRVHDAPQVVHAGGEVDAGAELRELQGDVALDARHHDGVYQLHVLAGGGRGGVERADAFAQVVERQVKAGRLQGASGDQRLVQGLARDEPAREAVGPRHAVARRQPLEPGAS